MLLKGPKILNAIKLCLFSLSLSLPLSPSLSLPLPLRVTYAPVPVSVPVVRAYVMITLSDMVFTVRNAV